MGPAMSKRARPASPPAEQPRANRPRAVAELLPAVGGAAFKRFGFVQSSIVSRWPEIVGERFARASAPESLRFPPGEKKDGVLTVTVRGAHAPMLQHVVPELIERVNRFFGYAAVARIQLRQGDVAQKLPEAERARPAPAPAEVGDGLKTIADPELRAVLESLAAGVHADRPLPRIR
jgi:hypothetical protein